MPAARAAPCFVQGGGSSTMPPATGRNRCFGHPAMPFTFHLFQKAHKTLGRLRLKHKDSTWQCRAKLCSWPTPWRGPMRCWIIWSGLRAGSSTNERCGVLSRSEREAARNRIAQLMLPGNKIAALRAQHPIDALRLPLGNHMRDFNAAREDARAAKGFKPEHRSGNSPRRDGQHASLRFNALNARTRSKIEV